MTISGCVDSITTALAIPDDQWSALARRRSVYATKQWYLATEQYPATGPRYLAYRDGHGCIRGLVRFFHATMSFAGSLDPVHVFRDAIPTNAPAEWWPCLMVGNRGNPNELLVAAEEVDADGRVVVNELARTIREIATEHDIPVVSMYMPEQDARLLEEAMGPGAVRLRSGTNSELNIGYSSLDEYLETLSRWSRKAVRKERRRFASAGYTVTTGNLADSLEEVVPLVIDVDRKHGADISLEQRRAALEEQARFLSDRSLVFLCRNSADELVACCLMYRHDDGLYAPHGGLDYRRLQDASEYFNVYFYQPLEYAIAEGFAHINHGFMTEAKRRRGYRPVAMYSVLWRPTWPIEGIAERVAAWNAQDQSGGNPSHAEGADTT